MRAATATHQAFAKKLIPLASTIPAKGQNRRALTI